MVAEDFTLDAMLEIDDSQVDDVNNELEANVTGGDGGEMSPVQRDQQESVVAGGFSTALKATGILAVLSQLTPITGALSAILGVIGRSLVPIIEKVADFIRPLVNLANQAFGSEGAIERSASAASTAGEAIIPAALTGGSLAPGFGTRTFDNPSDVGESVANDPLANFIGSLTGGGKNNAELSDEADKQQTKNNAEDAASDKTGNFGLLG